MNEPAPADEAVTRSLVEYVVEARAEALLGLGRWGGLLLGAMVGALPATLLVLAIGGLALIGSGPHGYTSSGEAVYLPVAGGTSSSVLMPLMAAAGLLFLACAGYGAHQGVVLTERVVGWLAPGWARREARRRHLTPDHGLEPLEVEAAVHRAAQRAEDE